MRGPDVLYAQRALRGFGLAAVEADGLFGRATETAVRSFQAARLLTTNGNIDRETWSALFDAPAAVFAARKNLADITRELMQPRQFRDSVCWVLTEAGIAINGTPVSGTPGVPLTVQKILDDFAAPIVAACNQHGVPVELVVATIATESRGDPAARREEPGFVSDAQTPHRVSLGLMQTLVSTAREATGDQALTAAALLTPAASIEAGTAYVAKQFSITGFDPPKVACAYNAGGIYYNPSANNRWKMRQYPIGTARHADRFVSFFNDCFCSLRANTAPLLANAPSLVAQFDRMRGP
jgi:hypothetical protein